MIPAREALSALLLLVLLAAALFVVAERPGPGPLALCTALATLHAALLGPLLGRGPAAWGLLPALLALPALFATSYGHAGAWPLGGSLILVALATASGTAARALGRERGGLYAPSIALAFALPYALAYLVLEMGSPGAAEAWRMASPWAAASRAAAGHPPPAAAVLLLLAWPVWALARGRR